MRLVVGVGAIAVMVLTASTADGHYLHESTARTRALKEAHAVSKLYGAKSESVAERCIRRSRHTVDCKATYRQVFVSGDGEQDCTSIIRIRFESPRSYKLRVSFPYPPSCMPSGS